MNSITLEELLILAFLPHYQSFVTITMRHKDYECWLEAIQSGTQVQEKPVPLVRRLSDGSRHGRAAISLTAGIKVSRDRAVVCMYLSAADDSTCLVLVVRAQMASPPSLVAPDTRHARPARDLLLDDFDNQRRSTG